MFDFKEAERRVRLGAVGIKRKHWTYEYLALYDNYATKNKDIQLYDSHYGAFWDLNIEDKQAEDWIDPAE